MSGYANSILGGASKLIRSAIQSPNYVPATSGWTVNKDGSAEFNNLTIRGTFFGTNYIINNSGAFFYSGTPALGNLIISITTASGTDAFGNVYLADFTVYGAAGTYLQALATGPQARFRISTGDSIEATPGQLLTGILGSGPTRKLINILESPFVTGNPNSFAQLQAYSCDAVPGLLTAQFGLIANDGVSATGSIFGSTQSVIVSGNGGSYLFADFINSLIVAGFPVVAGSLAGGQSPATSTALTLVNGWANQGGGLMQAQVIKNAQNEAHLLAVLNPAALTAAQFTTIPAGLRPTGAAVECGLGFHTSAGAGSGAFLRVATTGAASILNAVTTMGAVVVNCKIPLTTIT